MEKKLNEIKGLKWLPWIGKNYNETKLFIVGESHYEDGDFWQKDNKKTTQTIIEKRVFGDDKGKLHTNIAKTLLNEKEPSEEIIKIFWNSVAYWNIVQRLLDSREQKDRPNDEDFDKGWEIFFKIIEIINPKYCIIVGKSSLGRLGNYLANNKEAKWKVINNGFYETNKVIKLENSNKELNVIFINHASSFYSYKKFAEIIKDEHPELKEILLKQTM